MRPLSQSSCSCHQEGNRVYGSVSGVAQARQRSVEKHCRRYSPPGQKGGEVSNFLPSLLLVGVVYHLEGEERNCMLELQSGVRREAQQSLVWSLEETRMFFQETARPSSAAEEDTIWEGGLLLGVTAEQ
jgi:hypothetical protein